MSRNSRLFALICAHPGITNESLAVASGETVDSVRISVRDLAKNGKISSRAFGTPPVAAWEPVPGARIFPLGTSPGSRRNLALGPRENARRGVPAPSPRCYLSEIW